MSNRYDLLLKDGIVVDPANHKQEVMDLAVAHGKIVKISKNINPSIARECLFLKDYYIIPGIIDLHMHVSEWLGGRFGHKMMALSGVTTGLDMSGPIDSVLDIACNYGAGLNIGCLQYVRKGYTVKNNNPNKAEIEKLLHKSLKEGALGLKILGGHYPLTPEATALTIEVTSQNKAYVAFHCGTMENKSDIKGFKEAIELSQGNPIHIAHINSYCRGKVRHCIVETEEAIEVLKNNPHIFSESYLSPVNGTSAKCVKGVPESQVTRMCLAAGGFPDTEKGLEEAILDGWAQVNMEYGSKIILEKGKKAVEFWRSRDTDTTLSFKVNPEIPRLRLATAKRKSGAFVIDCISTDGGGIPRNVIVEMGLALVKLQVLSIEEFVVKTSLNPAKILGLSNKGHLGLGADADITVLNLENLKPVSTIANGEIIMWKGHLCGKGCRILTTPTGEVAVRQKGLQPIIIDPVSNPFFCRV